MSFQAQLRLIISQMCKIKGKTNQTIQSWR